MLFFVIGMPGKFAERCEALTVELVRKAFGAAELMSGNLLDEIAGNLLRSRASPGVVISRSPGGAVLRALTEGERPFVVFGDDPRSALTHLMNSQGIGVAAATRSIASICASNHFCSGAPGAVVLSAERYARDLLAASSAIARHLGLDLEEDDIGEVVQRVMISAGPDKTNSSAQWDALDEAEQRIAIEALGPFLDHSPNHVSEAIVWARELFFVGDQSAEFVDGGIDITGRARCLLRGPGILLPPATWSVTAHLEISADAAEHSYVLEANAGAALSRVVVSPARSGDVEANLSLAIAELPDFPLELRLYNERPAFGGHISLSYVTAVPSPPIVKDA